MLRAAIASSLLLALVVAACDDGGDAAEADASRDVARARVLFVGNSHTFFNDLPAVVRAIGDVTPGAAVEVDHLTRGGAELADHSTDAETMTRIANGRWDAVVIQGASAEPVVAPARFRMHAGLLASAVVDAGARPIWYATWARRADDPIYDAVVIDGGALTPESMTTIVADAYGAAARQSGGVVAGVGRAWQIALAEEPSIVLYAHDGNHASPAGTLLAACVIVAAITGEAPRLPSPPPVDIPPAHAAALCGIAGRR